MPIYEYLCRDCRRRVSLFWPTVSKAHSERPRCPRCGNAELEKLVSRVAFSRSEESRLEDLADPSSLAGLDADDPRSMARWMRKLGNEMGEDLGDDFDEMVDRMEAGEDPDDIVPEGDDP